VQYGQYPAPRFTIAHLSDVHLLAHGVRQYGTVEPEDGLHQALVRLTRLDPVPQALVFTGDLADRGEPDAYKRLRELVEPAAAAMGAQVIWVMGNHDARAPYAEGLFDSDEDGPQDRVYDVGGLRIVALDTSVPDYHHGDLTDGQLDWLRDLLSTPAQHGTVLAMHHPPIPVPTLEPAAIIELLDQERLADVIADSDVRQILGGHFHYSSHSTFAGVPVSVASTPCTCTTTASCTPSSRSPRRARSPASPARCARCSRRSHPRSGARSSAARTPTSTTATSPTSRTARTR
jgi:Icc protein